MRVFRPMADTSTSEALLFGQLQEGDTSALEKLLRVELPRLRDRIAREQHSQLGASLGATDVAQEAAARLLARKDELEFKDAAPMRAYLWRSAVNYIVDRLRRRRSRDTHGEPPDIAETHMMTARTLRAGDDENYGELFSAVRRLSWQDREIIDLVYLHGRSIKDAAKELGLAPDAARMRLNRALAKLKTLLGDFGK